MNESGLMKKENHPFNKYYKFIIATLLLHGKCFHWCEQIEKFFFDLETFPLNF